MRGLATFNGNGVVVETDDDPALVLFKLNDSLTTRPVLFTTNILEPLLHQVVSELVHTVLEGLMTVHLDQLRE